MARSDLKPISCQRAPNVHFHFIEVETKVETKMEFPFLKWKLDSSLHSQKRAMSEGQVICEGSEIAWPLRNLAIEWLRPQKRRSPRSRAALVGRC